MGLESTLDEVKGVGPVLAKLFKQLNIYTVGDLINHYPRRYDDFSKTVNISSIKPGAVTIKAVINHVKTRQSRRGLHITEAIAEDDTGSVRLVWFNRRYLAKSINSNQQYYISGNFELSYQRMSIMNPNIERIDTFGVHAGRIVPIYPETKELKSSQIRKVLRELISVIKTIPETLPQWLIIEQQLLSRAEAMLAIHFPDTNKQLTHAKNRIGFEEIFALTLGSLLNKNYNANEATIKIPFNLELAQNFVNNLPFDLTDDQRRVVWRIYGDMQKNKPMNRLIEGDVGTGKTVVATMAALMAMAQGYQVAFLAPTEILASQHASTISKLLTPLSLSSQITLLTGSMKPKQKKTVHQQITNGSVRMIVGTHAILQDAVVLNKLGLVIIDEQHRFGVEQRKKLLKHTGYMPHVISMTATPIPRSLALTLYGELDISVIISRPNNRQHISTSIVSPNSLNTLFATVDKLIEQGRQVFVVCPLIKSSDTMQGVSSADEIFKDLSTKYFKHRTLSLLHGKMKANEKDKIMSDFIKNKTQILVSTTVIEVGVDVPNASVMLIYSAERFGLAQLHQLRGRIGRGEHQGYCYAILSDSKPPSKRLRAFSQTNDGFKLSELDLELRGPGAIYGTLQHGQLDLRMAKLTDTKLIAAAQLSAKHFIKQNESLIQYKHLARTIHKSQFITTLN